MLLDAGSRPGGTECPLQHWSPTRSSRPTGFNASNLSAPIQPQKPEQGVTTGTYRDRSRRSTTSSRPIGQSARLAEPNRYASIDHAVHVVVLRQRCVRQPTAAPSSLLRHEFLLRPDRAARPMAGHRPELRFRRNRRRKPNVSRHPPDAEQAAFDKHVAGPAGGGARQFQHDRDQIGRPGRLVLRRDQPCPAGRWDQASSSFPLGSGDTGTSTGDDRRHCRMAGRHQHGLPPARSTISIPVTGPGALPPVFEIAVCSASARRQSDLALSEGPVRRDHRPVGAERRDRDRRGDRRRQQDLANSPRISSRPSRRSSSPRPCTGRMRRHRSSVEHGARAQAAQGAGAARPDGASGGRSGTAVDLGGSRVAARHVDRRPAGGGRASCRRSRSTTC